MNFQHAIQNSANSAMFSNISEKKSKLWANLGVSQQSEPTIPTPITLLYSSTAIPIFLLLQPLRFSYNSSTTLGKCLLPGFCITIPFAQICLSPDDFVFIPQLFDVLA